MTDHNSKQLYKDYWLGVKELRDKRCYYARLYRKIYEKLKIEIGDRIIDIGGGDGELLQYLNISKADILDISESGVLAATREGYRGVLADIEKEFPLKENSYNTVLCFEVLEHLKDPSMTLKEIHYILEKDGTLLIGQPNMRADGVHHLRRYYIRDLTDMINCAGFNIEWIDFVPAYSMRDAILDDIKHNPSYIRKIIQFINLLLSFLPFFIRYQMARFIPNRFALIFVVKAIKI